MKKKVSLDEVAETLGFIVEHMATKEDISDIRAEMATKKDLFATREDVAELRGRVKNLEKGQDEILEILRPMSRAQDADSRTIIDHEQRIVRLEKAVAA